MANIRGRTTSRHLVDFDSPIRLVELERMGDELQMKAHTGDGYGIELRISDGEVHRLVQAMSMMDKYRSLVKCNLREELWPAPVELGITELQVRWAHVEPAPPGRPAAPADTAGPPKEDNKAA